MPTQLAEEPVTRVGEQPATRSGHDAGGRSGGSPRLQPGGAPDMRLECARGRVGRRVSRFAAVALSGLILVSIGVLLLGHWGYAAQDRGNPLASSGAAHLFGTDDLGRDIAARVALALLLSLTGAAVASAMNAALAAGIGAVAGLAPRVLGSALMFAGDVLLTLPWLFLLMIVRAALPLNLPSATSAVLTFLLLGALGWPAFARVHYARARGLRRSAWMLQARAAGLPMRRVLLRHVLPHLRPVLLTQFLLYLPVCVTAEANLGTLGFGVREPLPSFGSMLYAIRGAAFLRGTTGVYLPVALLVVILLLLEMLVFGEEA